MALATTRCPALPIPREDQHRATSTNSPRQHNRVGAIKTREDMQEECPNNSRMEDSKDTNNNHNRAR